MWSVHVYYPRRGFLPEVSGASLRDVLKDREALVWLDIQGPSGEDMALLTEVFGFHPLAIEDVEQAHQRPKVDLYDEFYFLVLYAVRIVGSDCSLRTDELALFVGAHYLVTVHAEAIPVLEQVIKRWRANVKTEIRSVTALLYTLLDAIVDDYFPVVDALGDQIEDLEGRIFNERGDDPVQHIFQLKRDLLTLRRMVAPERDIVNVLMRRELSFVEARYVVYLQDVYDHLSRLTESVDLLREILSNALDAHVSVVSNRLNQVMKTLTALSAMLMTSGLVAGVYGMNFRHMPELEWRYGYPFALLLMAGIVVGLGVFFRRKGWL